MTTHFATDVRTPVHHKRSGGLIEGVCAVAGIVLAIIGLAGGARFFDAIADIVIGAAFLFETWTVLGASHGEGHERGVWADRIAGWAGVVLGILALLRLGPTVLAPIALIVFGAALVFGMGLASRPFRVSIGIAAIVLGILALIQLDPRTLTLIGLIAVSGVLLLTGPAVVARRTHRGAVPAV